MSLPPYDQSVRDFERQFQVVLPDAVGQAAVGFRDGVWFRLNNGAPHPVPIRTAIILCPHAAGSLVQIVCWWMREHPRTPRALDLATELALTVGELARKAIEEDPLGMSMTLLPSAPQPAAAPASQYGGGYDSGAYAAAPADPYPHADPYAAPASPYEPAYAAMPMAAATTLLPQITPDMVMPGRAPNRAPDPGGRPPGLSQPLPPSVGRPGSAVPGGAPRGPMNAGPGSGAQNGYPPPMGNSGSWDRPDPRNARPAPPRQAGQYDDPGPHGDSYRGDGPPARRPEREDYRQQDYNGRPPSRPPRQDPGHAW